MAQASSGIVGTVTAYLRRATRLVGSSIGALVIAAALAAPAGATSYPYHTIEFASCGGGGNYGSAWDFIEPRDPIIYAQNLKAGVAEQQTVAWHVRLNRWTGSEWIVDPERGGWSDWVYKQVVDVDSQVRYIGGAYSVPSGVRLWIPRLGTYYAVSYQVAWLNGSTGTWTVGPVEWVAAHLNLINGSVWIPDSHLGYFGCRYVKDVGSVQLPSPHI
jgi:hypothetical protein